MNIKNSRTLADLKPGETAQITVRVVDNSPLEFLIVEFGGLFRTPVMKTSAQRMELND